MDSLFQIVVEELPARCLATLGGILNRHSQAPETSGSQAARGLRPDSAGPPKNWE
jgi:hypothetical protein